MGVDRGPADLVAGDGGAEERGEEGKLPPGGRPEVAVDVPPFQGGRAVRGIVEGEVDRARRGPVCRKRRDRARSLTPTAHPPLEPTVNTIVPPSENPHRGNTRDPGRRDYGGRSPAVCSIRSAARRTPGTDEALLDGGDALAERRLLEDAPDAGPQGSGAEAPLVQVQPHPGVHHPPRHVPLVGQEGDAHQGCPRRGHSWTLLIPQWLTNARTAGWARTACWEGTQFSSRIPGGSDAGRKGRSAGRTTHRRGTRGPSGRPRCGQDVRFRTHHRPQVG